MYFLVERLIQEKTDDFPLPSPKFYWLVGDSYCFL